MIQTKRLILKPLAYEQLIKYLRLDNSLEEELNLNPNPRIISEELKDAFERTILPSVADRTKNYLYSTLWTIISKGENKMVGDICMAGEPNEQGEIEIGYGTYSEFRGKGFMTEAVGGMIEWTKKQSKIFCVIAWTEKENIASYTVLQKNGFVKNEETEQRVNWKLVLKK